MILGIMFPQINQAEEVLCTIWTNKQKSLSSKSSNGKKRSLRTGSKRGKVKDGNDDEDGNNKVGNGVDASENVGNDDDGNDDDDVEDDGDDEQEMDEPSDRIDTDDAKKPENHEYRCDSEKHESVW